MPPSGVTRRMESISTAPLPEAPKQPDRLEQPEWETVQYNHLPSEAGKRAVKRWREVPQPDTRSAIHRPVPGPSLKQPKLTPSSTVTTISVTSSGQSSLAVAGPSQPPAACSPTVSWARATCYRHKQRAAITSSVGTVSAPTSKLPTCSLCGEAVQGHKKYKKKTFCHIANNRLQSH